MPDFSRGEILAWLAGLSGLLVVLAVWLAYRLGRDRGLRCRSARLDRLYSELDLGGTDWKVTDTSSASAPNPNGLIKLYQCGVRLRAEGHDALCQPWSGEGVVFRRGVHLLFTERGTRGLAVGSLHLKLDPEGLSMTGMKSTWQGGDGHGAIETVTWQLCRSASGATYHTAVGRVAETPREVSTVAISPHSTNVFRPVDRAKTEVVDIAAGAVQGR